MGSKLKVESTMESLKQDLTCSMCFELFINPKALPCLHTFCRDCLHKYIISQATVITQHGKFHCPLCRVGTRPPEPVSRNIELWADSFTKNHLVVSLIENLKVHETTNNTLQNSNTSDCIQDVGEGTGTTNNVLCSICKLRPGNRWCEQCCQYLCDYCEKVHNKNPDTKIHVIVDATSNAESSNLPQGAESDQVVNSRPCSKHPGKFDSFYCVKCSLVCCSDCVSADHSSCFQVLPLQQAVQNKIQLGQVYTSIIGLQRDNLKHLQSVVSSKLQEHGAYHERLCREILSVRPMVDKLLVEDEKRLLDQLKTQTSKINTNLNQMQATCKNSIDVLDMKGELLKSTLAVNTVQSLYFLTIWDDISDFMKKNSSQHQDIKMQLENIHTSYFDFEQSNTVKRILKRTDSSIGSLVARRASTRSDASISEETCSTSYSTNPAPSLGRLSLKSSRNLKLDSEIQPLLTGICFLPDDVVVITDSNNNKLKMFDQRRQLRYCILPTSPYGVTYKVDTDQIIVSLPSSKELAYISSTLTIEKHVKVLKEYSAVLFDKHEQTLVCTSTNPACIDILYDDVVIRTLGLTNNRRPLFAEPEYLALHPKQNILVSDWEKKTLFYVDHKGNVVSTFTGELGINELQCPLGIAIDPNGLIYLADKEAGRIYRFSSNFKFESIVLTQSDHISQPVAMAFDSKGYLFVTENSGYLKLFG